MPSPKPIFVSEQKVYHADRCEPLVRSFSDGDIQLSALARGTYPGEPLKGDDLDGLRAIGYWDAAKIQNWGLDWHRNEGIEITYLEKGSLPFSAEGSAFNLRPGNITITRPWQPHRVGSPNVTPGKLHWLILDVGIRRPNQEWNWPSWITMLPADLERLTLHLRSNEHPVWKADSAMQSCWQNIAKAVERKGAGTSLSRVAAYVNELLVLTLEILEKENVPMDASLSTSERTVSLFLDELATHGEHLSYPWTVTEMAERCGLGATRFTEICQELENVSPSRFLTVARIEYAKTLWGENAQLSVTEVAGQCGFSSSQYFATVFKKETGQSPSAYREGRA